MGELPTLNDNDVKFIFKRGEEGECKELFSIHGRVADLENSSEISNKHEFVKSKTIKAVKCPVMGRYHIL